MLGVARMAGETAPLLFTALNNQFWAKGWVEPIASLPVMIYTYAIAPYEDWHRQAWAAGFVLLDWCWWPISPRAWSFPEALRPNEDEFMRHEHDS